MGNQNLETLLFWKGTPKGLKKGKNITVASRRNCWNMAFKWNFSAKVYWTVSFLYLEDYIDRELLF